MPVLEREDVRERATLPHGWGEGERGRRPSVPDAGEPPRLPPAFYWDDDGDEEGDDDAAGDGTQPAATWGQRLLAIVSILVLLSMIISPIAASLLAGAAAR